MKTFVMCKGLPASGKSTWAVEQVLKAEPGKAVRVNQDLLRTMLNADRFKGSKTEKFVRQCRDDIIEAAMFVGKDLVISDDTNFKPQCEETYRALCQQYDYQFHIQDFTHVSVKECIARDLKRERSVGHKVINQMNLMYLTPKWTPPEYDPKKADAIIVDIDGTLAHMVDRSPYDYTKVGTDVLDTIVHQIVLDQYEAGKAIILCSGRKDDCRDITEKWLADNYVPYEALLMRESGDNRDDAIVKSELYDQHIAPFYNVRFVLDDRDRVVAMWRARGLKCLQVADGNF